MKRISKILIFVLTCIFLFSSAVFAGEYSGGTSLHENQSHSYEKKEKTKTLTYSLTVDLQPSAEKLANSNELTYDFSAALYCATSRTFERTIDIDCIGEGGVVLRGGSYHINEENYIVSGTTYHYEANAISVPAGTHQIKIYIKNHVGTSQTMKINMDIALNSLRNDDAYIDKDETARESFTMKEYYAAGDTVGEGMDLKFYDIFSDSNQSVSLSDPTTLYRNAIINENNFYDWSQFAYQVIKNTNSYRDPHGQGFDADFGATDKNSNPGYYNDLVADFLYAGSTVVDSQNVYGNSSGLKHGSSMDDIFEEFTDNLADSRNTLLQKDDPSPLEGSDFRKHHALTKNGTSDGEALTADGGDIFYSYVCNMDRENASHYDYNGFLLLFYDFNMKAVCDDVTYEVTPTYDDPVISKTVTTNTNKANVSTGVNNSWTYSDSFSNTLSSSQTTTDSMTHGWNISIGGKIPIAGGISVTGGASGSYTSSEAFTFSDSKAQSQTYSQTSGQSVSATLPYYTVGELVSTTTTGTASTEYPCPIEITYKVAIVSVTGKFYDDGTAITDWNTDKTKVFLFGDSDGDAVGDIRARGLKDSLGTSDAINWNAIKAYPAPCSTANYKLKSGKDLLDDLGTYIPVTYDQAVASYSSTYTDYQVEIYPSLPLYRTAISEINSVLLSRNDQLYTSPGNYYDISSNISVNGYNKEGAEYYGFTMADGSWTLEYFDGSAVPENVAKLEKNAATGKTYLHIDANYKTNNKSTMPILLIYSIGKDVYKSYDSDSYVNNEDLTVKAALTIVVTEPPKELTSANNVFHDVASTSYYHNAVSYNHHFGYMVGISDSLFAPDTAITRGQFVTILHRIAEEEAKGSNPFTDVEDDKYYTKSIIWAAENGIVKGITPTLFAPDQVITREQMATILHRYAAHKGFSVAAVNDLSVYSDTAAISDYAKDAI
ncbi:MAG: S-layer homology domain-containing protein, partial [Firmicutes bacterium]|nr:S-layer homology domain-containing protein [Bacillota bacterium]